MLLEIETDAPPIHFSPWVPWRVRNQKEDKNLPGVYLISRYDSQDPPKGEADPLDSHIVYIGEATRKLKARWDSFNKATFFKTANTRRVTPNVSTEDVLFVGYMPVRESDRRYSKSLDAERQRLLSQDPASKAKVETYIKSQQRKSPAKEKDPVSLAWIKLVERQLIFEFCRKWGHLPECNKE